MSGTSSNNQQQRMKTSGTTSGKTSDNEWQRVTSNDNEWKQMTASGKTNGNKWEQVKYNDFKFQNGTKGQSGSWGFY